MARTDLAYAHRWWLTAKSVTAHAVDGRGLTADVATTGDTVRIRFPNVPEGAVIKVQWSR